MKSFLLWWLFAHAAWALPLQAGVVKVVSSLNSSSLTLRGSGFAFAHEGFGYVLTSDHVVFHDNENRRHQVFGQYLPAADCEIVMADFGRGLALLKTLKPIDPLQWTPLENLPFAPAVAGDSSVMMGYPAMSDSLIRDTQGVFTDVAADPELYAQIPNMIKVEKGYAEFGMSGGVLSNSRGEFLGTLSHQSYSDGDHAVQNTIFAIPARFIQSWLRAYFESSTLPVALEQNSSELLYPNSLTFHSNRLAFTFLDAFGDGHKVLHLSATSETAPKLFAPAPDTQRYLDFLSAHEDCAVFVRGFRERGKPDGEGLTAGNLVQVLRTMEEGKWEPITYVWCNGTDDNVEKLEGHYQTLEALVSSQNSAPNAQPLLRRLATYLNFIHDQSDTERYPDYLSLKPSDLEALFTAPDLQVSWNALDGRSQGQPLREALRKLIETMRLLTI